MLGFHHERTAGGGPRPGAAAAVLAGCGFLLLGGASIAPAQDTAPQPEPAAPRPATPRPAEPEPAAPEPAAPGYQVIVNAANTVTRLPAKTVANMFQKKTKRWENDEVVIPVDLVPQHPVRRVFTRAVHNRSVTAVVTYWQRIIFSKGGSPPESKASEEEVLAFVAATPGAIGYVSDDLALGTGVRQLQVDDLKANP